MTDLTQDEVDSIKLEQFIRKLQKELLADGNHSLPYQDALVSEIAANLQDLAHLKARIQKARQADHD